MFFSDCFWRSYPRWAIAIVLMMGSFASPLQAQVLTSSEDPGTIVTRENDRFDISGGALSSDGANLFHSFEQFGLNQGQVANFLANPTIRNILSRVMGGDASVINGLLQVTGGTPNLYLMNPAGIIFGSGARLDLPASFTATTAIGLGFNENIFSALQENDYSVLVGDPSSLIFAIVKPGAIVNAGVLSVPDLANLNLIAGQVLNLGTVTGGSVNITALSGQSILRITPQGRILSLDLSLPEGIALEDFSPEKLPQLLSRTELPQATNLTIQEDGSVWLVAPEEAASSVAIVGSDVDILAATTIGGDAVIESDRLNLTAQQIGTGEQPLLTQVNDLTANTAVENGNQFLLNLQDVTSLNLNAGTEGLVSLTVQGAIVDSDPEVDIQAGSTRVEAQGNIGTIASPLQTVVKTIAAQTSETGDIGIENRGNLTVGEVDSLAGVQTQSGTINLQVTEGYLTLNSSNNPEQITLQTLTSGNLNLTATEIYLNGKIQSANGQIYQGNLVLGSDVNLRSTQQGAIVFQGTIEGDQNAENPDSPTPRNLTVETGGLTQFNGAIGSISPLGSLETDRQDVEGERTELNTNLVQTIGNQRFNDPVTLSQSIQFNGENIEFGNSLEGQRLDSENLELAINAKSFTVQGEIGQQNPLSSISINTQDELIINGDSQSENTISLISQNGFIQTGKLQTQGGTINLQTLAESIVSQPNDQTGNVQVGDIQVGDIQIGDIQVGEIQSPNGSVTVNAKRLFQIRESTPIIADRLNLTAQQIGSTEQPFLTQVNNLSTDTALQNGHQFLLNLQNLTSLSLNAGTNGLLSLTVQGAIVDSDPEVDIEAGSTRVEAQGNIGTIASPLQTVVKTIAAQTSETGNIGIENRGNLTVGEVDSLAGVQTQSGTINLEVTEGYLTLNSSNNPEQLMLQTLTSGNLNLAATEIYLNGNIQSANGQTYQGNLVLGSDVNLRSTQQGAIVFQGTIEGDQNAENPDSPTPRNLTVETGGLTQFNGAIGSISPLGSLETDRQDVEGERTELNTNLVQTIGNQRFNDPVTLSQSIQFNGENIEFGNSLEGQRLDSENLELAINAKSFTAQGEIGQQNPLSSISINTQDELIINGDSQSENTISLTSQNGFIQTGKLQTQGGNVNLQILNETIANRPNSQSGNIQVGDIQVGAIQTNGGSVNINAKRFFRAIDTINGASISTLGSGNRADNRTGNGSITIVHRGDLFNQPFIVGDPYSSNNGIAGTLRTNIGTIPGLQAFLGSVSGGNIQILAGQNNPPVNIQFLSTTFGNRLSGALNTIEAPLETIEDINTLEFQNAFGRDPIRQATPQEVQKLLRSVNHRSISRQAPEKFAAIYLYYNREIHENNQVKAATDTIFSRGRILRPDDPPLEADRLSLLVVTEQEIKEIQLSDSIDRIRVTQSIQLLRNRLIDPYNQRGYKPFAAQLYDWIAKPITEALQDTPVDSLIFVLGRGLRSLPVAALYNRRTDQFFLEEYGLALVPSISYLDDEAVSLNQTQAIAMGASSFANNGNVPLPAVPLELDLIRQTRPTQVLQNEQFTFENLQYILNQRRQTFADQPLIMHLATHADFGEVAVLDPQDLRSNAALNLLDTANTLGTASRQIKDISYLQFFDRKLRLDELQNLELNQAGDVELFVISACNTATGSDTAELGFAGLSIQLGAQSAVASLWQVSDVGTMVLMGEFYDRLNQNISRIQALRQAQLAMLHSQTGQVQQNQLTLSNRSIFLHPELANQILVNTPDPNRLDLSHPFYWSAFTLIGSPW